MDNYYLYSSSGSARSKSAKWVCPNDRQLALRAKLRTGWSFKSASLDSRSFDYSRYSTASCSGNLSSTKNNQPLTEEERERIIEVIKKADALDLSEQERVGKLVDRLENMKKNVTVVTSTRASGRNCASRCIRGNKCVCCCALCGEKFSVLGAGPGLCRDCRNYVCQKCGIETTSTTNTNTLTTSPSASTNTGQQQQQQQHTTTITIGSTTNLTDNSKQQQQQQQPTTPPAKIFLCRICTETREMWKKSGAWFFKSLPKYVLPEKKPRGGSRGSHWTLAGGSRSLEPSELDSSSDEDLSRRPTRTRSFLFYSKSLDPSTSSSDQNKQNNNDSDIDTDRSSRKGSFLNLNVPDINQQQQTILLSPQNQLMVPNTPSAFSTSPTSPSPSSSLSPVPRSRSSSRLRDQKESQSSSSSSSPPPPPPPSTSTSQSSIFYIPFPSIIGGSCESINNNNNDNNNNNNNNNGKIILMTSNNINNNSYNNNNNKIISGERKSSIQEKKEEINNMIDNNNGSRKSRRQSINSSSNINNNEMENIHYQRDQDQSPQRHYQQRMENPSGMEKNEQKSYGNLEITLRYEPLYHCLQCKVERAKGLRAMDIQGHTDSYCKLNVLPIDEEDKKTIRKCQRTKTVYKTRDPEYNEQLNFYEIIENDLKTNKALHVLIVLDDVGGRDCLGEVKFPLRELQPCQTKYYNVVLEEHQDLNNQDKLIWGEDMSNARGKIQLSLTYNTRRRALLVNIQRANNLLPMDSNGLSDPFVKLCLTRDIINPKKLSSTSLMPSITSPKKKLSPKKIPKMSGTTHTSSVKWKTLNPEWNEDFYFETRLTELTEYALVITLWDKDFGKSNDYLGGLVLSCNSKGARLHQWIDAIKFPDHRHEASHELTEDITLYKSN